MKKRYFLLVTLVLLVNFIWESGHSFLYKTHSEGYLDFFLVHLKAALGDVLIFFIIYFLGAIFFSSKNWLFKKNKVSYFFVLVSGIMIAIMIEKMALKTGRWEYNTLMPIIPIIHVGLTPILQLTILPLGTLFFTKKHSKESDNYPKTKTQRQV